MLELNRIYNMDCLEGIKLLDDNSVDSIVTDPPYELGFMGKKWDSTGIAYNVELWKECLRVLKPGGHLLAFGGTRTYHRMVCAIEDAGFEIRDCIQWLYSTGFPKSHDISKAIDKKLGAERNRIKFAQSNTWREREGRMDRQATIPDNNPVTPEAKQWDGWGTALKPAHEPIVVARKPISEKTIAENVLKWGTGGLNIDGCRIGTEEIKTHGKRKGQGVSLEWSKYTSPEGYEGGIHRGRFPANVILDEEAGRMLDEQHKGASRFFYCAKASGSERGDYNNHPTVKPLSLIKHLVSLVTPVGGISLDPFMGSGTHAIACMELGVNFIGMEKEKNYYEISIRRIEEYKQKQDEKKNIKGR